VSGRARFALVTTVAATLLAGFGLAGVSAAAVHPHAAVAHSKSEGAKISLRKTSHGKVLVGANGHSLYRFDADTKNHSHCGATCRKKWAPVTTTGTPKAGAGVSASHLGVIKGHQVTYYGHPLYTFFKDTKAGQIKGDQVFAFGNYWWLVSAKGGKA
jgi:predicted lipoprotein with Yx(FWY)xxD motif